MARKHAQILLSVWSDQDFQTLTPPAQRLYFLLLSQKALNNAGVLPLMVSKWARGSTHTTPVDIEMALAELEAQRYVVVDRDTEEVLIRSFIRNDGVADHRYMLKNALTVAGSTESRVLRSALADELRRLKKPAAEEVADELDSTATSMPVEPRPNAIPMPPEPPSEPVAMPVDPESNARGIGEGVVEGVSGSSVDGSVALPTKRDSRATVAPDRMLITPGMRSWAVSNGVRVDLDRETSNFLDHHRAKGSTFKDWAAAWRTWMRNSVKFDTRRQPPPTGTDPDSGQRWEQ